MNHALNEKPNHVFDSTVQRVKGACEPLVRGMLFCDAAPLADRITGSSAFTHDFPATGPTDPGGRSLRRLRSANAALQIPVQLPDLQRIIRRPACTGKTVDLSALWNILTGKEPSPDFARLSADDRKAIREILTATLKDLPAYWK